MANVPALSLPTRWLVYRLGHLGDVVLTTGVLSHLHETRGWEFAVVTAEANAEVFANAPFVHSVLPVPKEKTRTSAFFSFCRELADAHHGWGLLDLHGTLRSRILSAVWKGPVRRYPKYGIERRVFLATHGKFFGERLRASNVTQRYCMAIDSPPPPPASLLPRLWLSDEETRHARETLAAAFPGTLNPCPVALHPYATHALKAWPHAQWLALAELLDERGIPWIAVGKGAPFFPKNPEAQNDFTNTTNLRETFALLAACRVLITGDSGPMHMAAGVETPVIALFGPTVREWGFYPAGERDIVIESPLACRPCSLHGKKPCPAKGDCLSAISAKSVMQAIEENFASI